MSRNRIIYQSEALFTSPAVTGTSDVVGDIATGDVVCLQRVTEISNNAEITRQDVNVFGQLASISREIIEEPTVTMDVKYYLADGYNESGIGLVTDADVNCISGILANSITHSKRNYYVITVDEGLDANTTAPSGKAIIGIGNAYLTNYTVDASVGEIPSASFSVEAANITFGFASGEGIQNPSVDIASATTARLPGNVGLPTATTGTLNVKVLRPGDITMDFGDDSLQMGGAVLDNMLSNTGESAKQSAHIQSFSLEVPLSRTPLKKLGRSAAFSRELDVPITVSMTVNANLADIDEGSLNNMICAAAEERTIAITLKEPCGGDTNMVFTLKGATLESQNMSATIGDSKTVELKFSAQVGGPNDQTKGLFITPHA